MGRRLTPAQKAKVYKPPKIKIPRGSKLTIEEKYGPFARELERRRVRLKRAVNEFAGSVGLPKMKKDVRKHDGSALERAVKQEVARYVPPTYLGEQIGRYARMLEAHYAFYLESGQIDRATSVMVTLLKMSVVMTSRAWAKVKELPPQEALPAAVDEEIAAMSDEELAAQVVTEVHEEQGDGEAV